MRYSVTRGNGFRGVLNYCLQPGKFAGTVSSNMSSIDDPARLAREFGAIRRMKPRCGNPVWHTALACPPGERLSDVKWNAVVRDFMSRMGLDDRYQHYAVRHDDKDDHDHVHIVANRIGGDGSIWHGKNEALQILRVLKELEVAHGLTLTFDQDEVVSNRSPALKQSKREKEMYSRKGFEVTPKEVLAKAIEEALRGQPTFSEFSERLRKQGIKAVQTRNSETGAVRGASFQMQDGKVFSGSQVAKRFGWAQLAKRLTPDDPMAEALAAVEFFEPQVSYARPARHSYQMKLIIEIYGEALPFIPSYVGRREDGAIEFRLAGGQRLFDADIAVSLSGYPDSDAISAMVDCVVQHGWTEVHAEGTDAFKAEFVRQAAERGIRVVDDREVMSEPDLHGGSSDSAPPPADQPSFTI